MDLIILDHHKNKMMAWWFHILFNICPQNIQDEAAATHSRARRKRPPQHFAKRWERCETVRHRLRMVMGQRLAGGLEVDY
jgi:hypothetical protein